MMHAIHIISYNIIRLHILRIVISASALMYASTSSALHSGEFIVFPTVNIESRSSLNDSNQKNTEPVADFFYANDYGNQRLLIEALAEPEDDESELDLERLQYGWILSPETDIWIGRFHNPLGFWNTHFHHGSYLETSASRPAIMHFEDDNGILPMHISGLQINGPLDIENGGFHYSIGVGAGPEIINNKLKAVKILDPGEGRHELGGTIRLTYQPNDDDMSTQFGGVAAYTPIPGDNITTGDIKQTVISVYGVWDINSIHNLGSIFHIINKFDNSDDDSFTTAYIQSEYTWHPDWTTYGRIETSSDVHNDTYLSLFPQSITQRQLVGIRHELKKSQALKLEISSAHTHNENYDELHIQWSAAIQ